MAFESLSERLQESLKKIRGQATLTEENMDEMLREIRLALLEADVNFQVVKEFIANTKEKALGQDVLGSLKPGQVVVKIVHDELVELLGTKVKVVPKDEKKGKIEIEYYSPEDLERIYDLLNRPAQQTLKRKKPWLSV